MCCTKADKEKLVLAKLILVSAPKIRAILVLEAAFFRIGFLPLFGLVIIFFCFQSNLDQSRSD